MAETPAISGGASKSPAKSIIIQKGEKPEPLILPRLKNLPGAVTTTNENTVVTVSREALIITGIKSSESNRSSGSSWWTWLKSHWPGNIILANSAGAAPIQKNNPKGLADEVASGARVVAERLNPEKMNSQKDLPPGIEYIRPGEQKELPPGVERGTRIQ